MGLAFWILALIGGICIMIPRWIWGVIVILALLGFVSSCTQRMIFGHPNELSDEEVNQSLKVNFVQQGNHFNHSTKRYVFTLNVTNESKYDFSGNSLFAACDVNSRQGGDVAMTFLARPYLDSRGKQNNRHVGAHETKSMEFDSAGWAHYGDREVSHELQNFPGSYAVDDETVKSCVVASSENDALQILLSK